MVTNFACVWSNFSITLNFYHFGRKLMKWCGFRPIVKNVAIYKLLLFLFQRKYNMPFLIGNASPYCLQSSSLFLSYILIRIVYISSLHTGIIDALDCLQRSSSRVSILFSLSENSIRSHLDLYCWFIISVIPFF